MVYIGEDILIMKNLLKYEFLLSVISLAREKELDTPTSKNEVGIQFHLLLITVIFFLIGCSATKEMTPEYYWPTPPETPRYKFLNIIQDNSYFSNSKSKLLDVLAGEEKSRFFFRPFGIIVDKNKTIYVTDTNLKKVIVIDDTQKKVKYIGDKGTYKLHTPIDIAVADNDLIFVTDSFLKRVFVYDKSGNLLKMIGGDSIFLSPTGIAYDSLYKRLYIVDTNQHCVIVMNLDGQEIFRFGERGSGDGQFNFPVDIAIGLDKVYVVDSFNGRIQIFDLAGKYISKFGGFGTSPGYFSRPKSIALDSDENIYVTDAAFDNFQIFNQNGEILMFIGGPGPNIGEFQLPAGIFIDHNDNVYVVDQLNCRIQVFQYLKK